MEWAKNLIKDLLVMAVMADHKKYWYFGSPRLRKEICGIHVYSYMYIIYTYIPNDPCMV